MKFILEERFILFEADDELSAETNAASATLDTLDLSSSGSVNWAERYAECKTNEDFDKFWKGDPDPRLQSDGPEVLGYYKYVWGKNADTVEQYGILFINTLKVFGWDADSNPFIAFLEAIIANKFKIKLEQIKPDDFESLYMAVEKDLLQPADLMDGGELNAYNLIYNVDFYNKPASEQMAYLEAQSMILEAGNIPKVSNAQIPVVFANIYSKKGDLTNVLGPIQPGDSLRAVQEINVALRKLLGKNKEQKVATDTSVAKVLSYVKSPDDAKKMIAFLVDAQSLINPKAVQTANATTKGAILKTRNSIKTTTQDTERYIKWLGGLKYNAEQINSLFLKLAEIGELYTPQGG